MRRWFPALGVALWHLSGLVGQPLAAAENRELQLRSGGSDLTGLDRETVQVRAFSLVPFANLTAADDRLVWHPTAYLALGYDDNVFQAASDESADGFVDAEAGLELRHYWSATRLLVYQADVFVRRYQDEDARDFTGWQLGVEQATDDEIWVTQTRLFFRQQDDPAIETGRTIERREYGLRSDAVREGREWEIIAGGSAMRVDFREDGRVFGRDERDRWTATAYGGLSHRSGERASISGRLWLLGSWYATAGVAFQDSIGVRATGIVLRPIGDRAVVEVEAGLEARFHDDDFANDARYDDATVIWPYLAADLQWLYADNGSLTVSASSQVVDGANSNALLLYGLRGRAEHRLPRRLTLEGSLGWTHRRASGSATGSEPESDSYTLELGLRYELRSGFAFRLNGLHRILETDGGAADFDQTILTLGAAAAF